MTDETADHWTRQAPGHYTAKWDDGTTTVVTKDGDDWSWVTYDGAGVAHGSGETHTLAEAKAEAESQPQIRMHEGYAEGALNLAANMPPLASGGFVPPHVPGGSPVPPAGGGAAGGIDRNLSAADATRVVAPPSAAAIRNRNSR